MQIRVNGEKRQTGQAELSGLLRELGYQGETFAVAINGDFVPRTEYTHTRIQEGDSLDLVAPVVGG